MLFKVVSIILRVSFGVHKQTVWTNTELFG